MPPSMARVFLCHCHSFQCCTRLVSSWLGVLVAWVCRARVSVCTLCDGTRMHTIRLAPTNRSTMGARTCCNEVFVFGRLSRQSIRDGFPTTVGIFFVSESTSTWATCVRRSSFSFVPFLRLRGRQWARPWVFVVWLGPFRTRGASVSTFVRGWIGISSDGIESTRCERTGPSIVRSVHSGLSLSNPSRWDRTQASGCPGGGRTDASRRLGRWHERQRRFDPATLWHGPRPGVVRGRPTRHRGRVWVGRG